MILIITHEKNVSLNFNDFRLYFVSIGNNIFSKVHEKALGTEHK